MNGVKKWYLKSCTPVKILHLFRGDQFMNDRGHKCAWRYPSIFGKQTDELAHNTTSGNRTEAMIGVVICWD